MRIGKPLDFFWGSKLNQPIEHVGNMIRFDAGDEFAIRIKSCATFAVTNIISRIKLTIPPKSIDTFDAISGFAAAFKKHALNSAFNKAKGGKQARRSTSDNYWFFKLRCVFCQ